MATIRLGETLYINVPSAGEPCILMESNTPKKKKSVKNAEAKTFIQKNDEFKEGTVGNVIPNHQSLKPSLTAIMCPYCYSVFTLEFSSKAIFKSYSRYDVECPCCHKTLEATGSRIPIWLLKLLRWIRWRKTNEDHRMD